MERLCCRLPVVGLTCIEAEAGALRAVRFLKGEEGSCLCPPCQGQISQMGHLGQSGQTGQPDRQERPEPEDTPGPLVREAARQLEAWLCKKLRCFDLPLAPQGTPFQQEVWQALRDIPYGQTRSYKAVALAIGRPGACRAVGMANNRNPLNIIIPCHRVIGANGRLVGYGGGLRIKAALLRLEGNLL